MKGIILAGGSGSRLHPLTKVTSKQLLPIYNKQMIFYPLETLIKAGIEEILIIVSPDHPGDFLKLLGSGSSLGVKLTYEIQDKPAGLPEAFIIGENFIGSDSIMLILGDNLFDHDFVEDVRDFKGGAHIFTKKVHDPERFGVVKMDENRKPLEIKEKPKTFLSDLAITGIYMYDNRVVEIAKSLEPSSRNELEIVDLHNWYLKNGELKVSEISGEWIDAGTFESLYAANLWAHSKVKQKEN